MTKTNRKIRSNNDLVVAGIGADGHGVMTGFRGDGPLVRSRLLDMGRRSGIDETWMPPAKDAKVQLSRAIRKIALHHGMSAEPEKKKNRQVVEARDWASCWSIISSGGEGAAPRAGEAFGRRTLVATLFDDAQGQSIEFDPPDHPLAVAVQEEYDRIIGAEVFQAADVTGWLNRIHRDLLLGVRYGAGWYVPREHRAIAEQIAETFWVEERWGEAWMYPPLPVASSDQLSRGIAFGLQAEVDEQLALLGAQRRRLREMRGGHDRNGNAVEGGAHDDKGELVDIGARAAESFAVRFARVGHRVAAYAAQLGDDLVAECTARIHDAMIEIDAVLEGGATKDGVFRDVIVEQETAAKPVLPEQSFAALS